MTGGERTSKVALRVDENEAQAQSRSAMVPFGVPYVFYAVLVYGGVCYARRRMPIGGWLMFFYLWIGGEFLRLFLNSAEHPRAYLGAGGDGKKLQLALVIATIPRLIAVSCALVAGVALMVRREWKWVERLRMYLIAATTVSGISVAMDAVYFKPVLGMNLARCAGLAVWTAYFYQSERVERVFLRKDWVAAEGAPSGGAD